jgi:hypothetical protein
MFSVMRPVDGLARQTVQAPHGAAMKRAESELSDGLAAGIKMPTTIFALFVKSHVLSVADVWHSVPNYVTVRSSYFQQQSSATTFSNYSSAIGRACNPEEEAQQ